MKYFLRFTDTPNEDLERGISLLDLPSLETLIVLPGLCGYSFCEEEEIEHNILSDKEIEKDVRMYQKNVWYSGTPVLFKGEYIKQNPNSEGVIFKALEIYKQF